MYYSKTPDQVLIEFNTKRNGLSSTERLRRLSSDGKNLVESKQKNRFLEILRSQIFNLLVFVLLAAALLSFLTNHAADAIVILAVIVINTTVGFVQEYRAEKALESLKKLLVRKSKVMVEGQVVEVDSETLVKGDIVVIEEGDIIPADGRILQATLLKTNESALTGESLPIDKDIVVLDGNLTIGEQKNMLFSSTLCVSGRAEFVVTATALDTQVGQIAEDLESIDEGDSHFNKITTKLTQQMGVIALLGAMLILFIGYFVYRYEFTEIFLFSLASLVSSIPEGLPAILTIVLAIGSYRMSRQKAIVRRLSSTETLASVNIICTDKTGTLTENKLKVEYLILNTPELEVLDLNALPKEQSDLFENSLMISYYSNGSKTAEETGGQPLGDPTELALKIFAINQLPEKKLKVIEDIPFSSDRKFRATRVIDGNAEKLFVVGAPEKIIEISSSTEEEAKKMYEAIASLSSKALRVLALGESENVESLDSIDQIKIIGFVAMRDPIREGVKEAVAQAKRAGIRTIMMTGDHIETAKAIAIDCGIIETSDSAISEKELAKFGDEEFDNVVRNVNVFGRLSPSTKLKILQVLQAQGNVVAMTGDGVNDAPALKQADVGISMGQNGTETARESSDIVLADDNYATIIHAVSEGRLVFQNIRRASAFLITTNVAEQITIITTLLFGLPLPLLAAQILWLNLVTDGVNDFALATEKSHGTELSKGPRNKDENILNYSILRQVLIFSTIMAVLTLLFFTNGLSISQEYARTEAFLVMSFTQLFSALNFRSFTKSLFKIGVFSNKYVVLGVTISGILTFLAVATPFLRNFLRFEEVTFDRILLIFACSSLVFIGGEISKRLIRKNSF